MKKILLLSILAFYTQINAQNVGIGTPTPAEKLDVTGNINLTGQLKLNSNAGQPGDVLTVNSLGQQVWASRFTTFGRYYTTSTTITIPAEVTQFMVECWGAGGGGSFVGGGAAGGYAYGVFSKVGSQTFTITVGTGGIGAATALGSGTDGGNTFVIGTGVSCVGAGGNAAYDGNRSGGNPTFGSGATGSNLIQGSIISGEGGTGSQRIYSQKNSTTWVYSDFGGNGGSAPLAIGQGGIGNQQIRKENDDSHVYLSYSTSGGYASGGGGGIKSSGSYGSNGGGGYVIIRW